MNMHARIEEPISNQRINKHNSRGIVGIGVFFPVRANLRIGYRELSSEMSVVAENRMERLSEVGSGQNN
jgi:hypothetical protein